MHASQVNSALYANLAKALFARFYGKLLFHGWDVVQLVRTLPRHWLESRTVTAGRRVSSRSSISPS